MHLNLNLITYIIYVIGICFLTVARDISRFAKRAIFVDESIEKAKARRRVLFGEVENSEDEDVAEEENAELNGSLVVI